MTVRVLVHLQPVVQFPLQLQLLCRRSSRAGSCVGMRQALGRPALQLHRCMARPQRRRVQRRQQVQIAA